MTIHMTSKDLLASGFLEHYYDSNTLKMFEYIICNRKKMQSGIYANVGCVNYIIPPTLRKMFQVTHKQVDIPRIFTYELTSEELGNYTGTGVMKNEARNFTHD